MAVTAVGLCRLACMAKWRSRLSNWRLRFLVPDTDSLITGMQSKDENTVAVLSKMRVCGSSNMNTNTNMNTNITHHLHKRVAKLSAQPPAQASAK